MARRFYGLVGTKFNVAIALLAGLDFTLFGYDQGVMGGLLTLQSFLGTFPTINTQSPPDGISKTTASNVQGIAVGAYTLGCFFGALFTIWAGNKLGRKRTIMAGASTMIIGAAIQASSSDLPQLIASRFITGFGNGMSTSTVPMWQSETSESNRRGLMVMIEGSLIAFGIMLSYWLDLGFSFFEPSSMSWRFPIAFQIILALMIVIALPGLPESPRWLVLKGREQEAIEVLCALSNLDAEHPKIKDEIAAVKGTVQEMSRGRFRDCFKLNRNRNLHRTALAYIVQMFQQISGINIITYYAASIFMNNLGMTPDMSRLLAAANGTEYFVASIVAIFTVERFGRRKLMLLGAIGMSASMAILAGTTSVGPGSPEYKEMGLVAAVFLFVFNSFFAIGWLGMTWLYPAEITPLAIRAPANALSTTANLLFNFLVVMVTPPAFTNIKYKTYIIFSVVNASMALFTYFFFPETSGRSLEEMDEVFHEVRGFKGVFDIIHVAHTHPKWSDTKGEGMDQGEGGTGPAAARRAAAPSKEWDRLDESSMFYTPV